MKLSEVLSKDQRSARFSGKRKRNEGRENLESPIEQRSAQSPLSIGEELPRRSVIRARSELFPNTPPIKPESNQSDEENSHCIEEQRNDKNMMKRVVSEGGFLTDKKFQFGIVGDDEKKIIWESIYQHKKFSQRTSRVIPSSEPDACRPSVIVRHESKAEKDLERLLDLDFIDLSSVEPTLEAEINIEEVLNISDFNLHDPTVEMYNLYFVDNVSYVDTLRKSFFAVWRTLPLGESVMADYIRFCQDKTATLPNYWTAMAVKQTR